MNIRLATEQDIPALIGMMKKYSQHSPINVLKTKQNEMYVLRLLASIIRGNGCAWIAEKNNNTAGMLLSILVPNIWNPRVVSLQELAWWVEPEYRNTTAGYRLAQAYTKHANTLRSDGNIEYWTISKMNNSPDIDYTRFGASKLEETHICQGQ